MGYFANSTEGDMYEDEFCSKCHHHGRCAVMEAHYVHNYAECNKEDSILHMLIPRGSGGIHNARCKMFVRKTKTAE